MKELTIEENEKKWGIHGKELLKLSMNFFKEITKHREIMDEESIRNTARWDHFSCDFDTFCDLDFFSNEKLQSKGNEDNMEDEFTKIKIDLEDGNGLFLSPIIIPKRKNISLDFNEPSNANEPSLEQNTLISMLDKSELTIKYKQDFLSILKRAKQGSIDPRSNDEISQLSKNIIYHSLTHYNSFNSNEKLISPDMVPSLNFNSLIKTLSPISFNVEILKKNVTKKKPEETTTSFISNKELTKGFRNSLRKAANVFSKIFVELYIVLESFGFYYTELAYEDYKKEKRMLPQKHIKKTSVVSENSIVDQPIYSPYFLLTKPPENSAGDKRFSPEVLPHYRSRFDSKGSSVSKDHWAHEGPSPNIYTAAKSAPAFAYSVPAAGSSRNSPLPSYYQDDASDCGNRYAYSAPAANNYAQPKPTYYSRTSGPQNNTALRAEYSAPAPAASKGMAGNYDDGPPSFYSGSSVASHARSKAVPAERHAGDDALAQQPKRLHGGGKGLHCQPMTYSEAAKLAQSYPPPPSVPAQPATEQQRRKGYAGIQKEALSQPASHATRNESPPKKIKTQQGASQCLYEATMLSSFIEQSRAGLNFFSERDRAERSGSIVAPSGTPSAFDGDGFSSSQNEGYPTLYQKGPNSEKGEPNLGLHSECKDEGESRVGAGMDNGRREEVPICARLVPIKGHGSQGGKKLLNGILPPSYKTNKKALPSSIAAEKCRYVPPPPPPSKYKF